MLKTRKNVEILISSSRSSNFSLKWYPKAFMNYHDQINLQ